KQTEIFSLYLLMHCTHFLTFFLLENHLRQRVLKTTCLELLISLYGIHPLHFLLALVPHQVTIKLYQKICQQHSILLITNFYYNECSKDLG
ncbi:Hypothetical predicted protein, partial [Paramuricea clavata]